MPILAKLYPVGSLEPLTPPHVDTKAVHQSLLNMPVHKARISYDDSKTPTVQSIALLSTKSPKGP
jgi:hypothetical protein